eukprot:CAMPEP_0184717864 /NCGR_PEP_ID=MMETSP0314-20130426/7204_1 /TAXON_ID=38298 /ORGANISM="Rhodella maculata, Strain CCMP 736" /LENGTH=81 /DNA_ID=CAMNT_0027181503 /DNA_START=879 /DNA_END=1124 /DNA_ORIENTATION=-
MTCKQSGDLSTFPHTSIDGTLPSPTTLRIPMLAPSILQCLSGRAGHHRMGHQAPPRASPAMKSSPLVFRQPPASQAELQVS